MMPRSKSHREHIVIHAWYRRHRIARADVVSVDVGTLWEGEAGWRWYPKLRLRDGSQVWIRALDLGRAGKPVQDEEMKVVYELCQLLGVSGEVGASRRMADEHLRARPFHDSGAGALRVPLAGEPTTTPPRTEGARTLLKRAGVRWGPAQR